MNNKLFSLFFSILFFVFNNADIHDRHPKFLESFVYPPVKQMFHVTSYTPDSHDGISGSGSMASGRLSYIGSAACPIRLKFGTRILLTGAALKRAVNLGIPWDLICEDRFRNVYREGIDINLPAGYYGLSNAERIVLAKKFGIVYSSANVYERP